jgi:uncharacterized protein (DUF2267 family)
MFNDIKALSKTCQETGEILNALMAEGVFANKHEAFTLIRTTMQVIRDRIEIGEAIHMAGQLPALLRGFFYENWKYSGVQQRRRTKIDFIEEISSRIKGNENLNVEKAIAPTLRVLLSVIDRNEAKQVVHCLPKEIQSICPSEFQ